MSLFEIVFFLLGFGLLVGGADIFVRGASQIARGFEVSPVVIGLTIVAFGTSAPELGVTLESVFKGSASVAIGNVIGSNIANVLLILGLSSLLNPLIVKQEFLKIEIPLLIAVTLLFWFMASDGLLSSLEGMILFVGSIVYTLFTVWSALRERRKIRSEYAKAYRDDKREIEPVRFKWNIFLIVAGFIALVVGSKGIVQGAVKLALLLGMDELIVGLTVVAIGTSLPEIAASVVASRKKQGDMAIGNVVGSNMFNVLVVIGLGAAISPEGMKVTGSAIAFDFPFMCVVTFALLPVAITGSRIDKKEGILFLVYYAVYTVYLILQAKQHSMLSGFTMVAFYFCGPLIILGLMAAAWRYVQSQKR